VEPTAVSKSETPSPFDLESVELLSLNEFGKRVGIGRTKIFQMKKDGILIRGRHYIQFGRKILFPWGPEFLQRLLLDCSVRNEPPVCDMASQVPKLSVEAPPKTTHKRRKPVIDAEYCMGD